MKVTERAKCSGPTTISDASGELLAMRGGLSECAQRDECPSWYCDLNQCG